MTTLAMVLIFASPVYSAAFAYRTTTRGHLRQAGGYALLALLTFASIGFVLSALLVTGVNPVSDIVNVLAASAGIGVAALTAAAIYLVDGGWPRRVLLVSAALLLPTAVGPLLVGLGVAFILLGWTVYFTLAIYNPPLRASEVSLSG